MLGFIALVATGIAAYYLQRPLYRTIERYIDRKINEEFPHQNHGAIDTALGWLYILSISILATLVYGYTVFQVTFPIVFTDSYIATYENGKVVERKWALSYVHGDAFYVSNESVLVTTSGDTALGNFVISRNPFLTLDRLRVKFEITNRDLFFSHPGARVSQATYFNSWIGERAPQLQWKHITAMQRGNDASFENRDCWNNGYDYFEKIRHDLNLDAATYGLNIVWVGDRLSYDKCDKTTSE